MQQPSEHIIHRKLLKIGKNPAQFDCPQEYRIVVWNLCVIWAKCFRNRSDDSFATVSVERFLTAADFSIIFLRNEMREELSLNDLSNQELWKWILVVAEKVVSQAFFFSMETALEDPLVVVKLPTFVK